MRPDTLTGQVVAPWDPGYDMARLDYNLLFDDIYPRYVLYCDVVEDVVRAVRWARRHRVPFRIRSGGHSYEGFSLVQKGLVIDVSQISQVTFDPESGRVRIGAGAQLLDIYDQLWNAGRVTIPGGSCATVGIAGLTLGGGFGLVSRPFGLTIDALESITMVDARGDRVEASEDSHPELFWALRGAGANNFGAVVEFSFRTFPVDDVVVFSIRWPWDQIPEVLPVFQRWSDPDQLDRRMTPILSLNSKAVGRISVIGEFLGPQRDAEHILAPLLAIRGHSDVSIQSIPYIDAVHRFAGVGEEPQTWRAHGLPADASNHDTFKNTSAYAYEIFPKAAIRIIQRALSHTPGPAALVQLGGFGGAIRDVAPDQTAFFHRLARSEMQYQTYWTQPADAPAHIRWVEEFRQAMNPFTLGAYVNYCDLGIDDWPEAYWGDNVPRLKRIKQEWDPRNVFRFPQGLSELTGCRGRFLTRRV